MATPESPYPYHSEAWAEIGALSVAVLAEADIQSSPSDNIAVVDITWRRIGIGFACRLERPLVIPDDETVYTFAIENDQKGMRQHISNRTPFITAGLREPVPRRDRPHDFGILKYSQAQGLVEEPRGILPGNYLRSIVHVADMNDPEQRARGFEKLLADFLEPVSRGIKHPL